MSLNERIAKAKLSITFAQLLARREESKVYDENNAELAESFTKFKDSRDPWNDFRLFRDWEDFSDCW